MAKSAKKAFQKIEERYHVLFEMMRDGVVYVDMEGRIIECNQAYADMLGYSRDELRGVTYQELTPEEWHEMEDEIVKEEIMKKGYSDLYEKELLRKDGTVFPVNIRVSLIRDEDGQVVGMWRIIRDITLRKSGELELRRSEERYRKLFELSPDAILTFNLAGLCTSFNPAAERNLGYSKEEVVGSHISKLPFLRARDIPNYIKVFNSIWEGKVPAALEIPYVCKDGSSGFGEANFGVLKEDDKIVGLTVVVRDVTERKQLEDQDRLLHVFLRQDLKGKIQDIQGFVEQLGRTSLSGKQEEYVQSLKELCKGTAELIDKSLQT